MTRKRLAESERQASKDSEMDMTSMIDVTFLLLIFFMCTLKFKTLEGRLSAFLPKDTGISDERPLERPDPIDVGIHVRTVGTRLNLRGEPWSPRTDQRLVYGDDRRIDYSIGPRHGLSLARLKAQLARLGPQLGISGVVLAAGPQAVQADAIAVLDLLIDVGVREVRIKGAR